MKKVGDRSHENSQNSELVDESAVTIEISDDDSSADVIDAGVDKEKAGNLRNNVVNCAGGKDIGNIESATTSNFPEDGNIRLGSSEMAVPRKASPKTTSVSLVSSTPTIPSSSITHRSGRKSRYHVVSCNQGINIVNEENATASSSPEAHKSRLGSSEMAMSSKLSPETVSLSSVSSTSTTSGTQRSGKKPTPKSFPEDLLDEDDLEHLRMPFKHGWKRELVYRNTTSDPNNKRSMCDIYYFPPGGKKLRSMVEVSTYLESQKNCPVNLTHFTFKRKPFFKPPYEIVRTAGKAYKKLQNVEVSHKSKEKKTSMNNTERKNSEKSTVGITLPSKSVHTVGLFNQLPVAATDSPAVSKDATTETLSTPALQVTAPAAADIPKESQVLSAKHPNSDRIKRRGRKRARRLSPDWTPEYDEDSRSFVKKRRSLGNPQRSDDEDNELQDVLGTPSKLIASIVRSEPSNKPLDDGGKVAEPASKKLRVVSGTATQSFIVSAASSVPALVGNSGINTKSNILFFSSPFLSTTSNRVCSRSCPGMAGIEPCHQCTQCGKRYHKVCTEAEPNCKNKALCLNCGRGRQEISGRIMPLPSGAQFNPQKTILKLVPTSMAPQILGSNAVPRVPSTGVQVSSSDINKPLLTPHSRFLPQQVLPRVVLIPGQNASKIPPPPPLSSRPQFDSPVTPVPLHLTPKEPPPPPPRLQLCSIPQACQLPPLLLAGSASASNSQTSPFMTQLPTLEPCLPLLAPKPVSVQPSLTTASNLKPVSGSDTEPHTRNTGTQADLPMITVDSDLSNSKKHDLSPVDCVNVEDVSEDIVPETIPPTRNVCIQTTQLVTPGPLAETALVKPMKTDSLEPFGSETNTEALRDVEDVVADVSLTRNQACRSVLSAVKDLVKQRTRTQSSNDINDILDYPPVVFAPAAADSANHLPGGPDDADHHQTSHSVNCGSRLESVNHKSSGHVSVLQPDQLFSSSRVSSIIKDILSRPSVDNLQKQASDLLSPEQSARSSLPSSLIIRIHPELSGKTSVSVSNGAGLNSQPLTLPHFVTSKLAQSEVVTLKINNRDAQPQLNAGVFNCQSDSSAVSGKLPVSAHTQPERMPTEVPESTRKHFLCSFRILQTSFTVMMNVFGMLPLPDLLRASRVCKIWHTLAMQPCLWKRVHLAGIRVCNWELAAQFFNKMGVNSLNLKGVVLQSGGSKTSGDVWDSIKKNIPRLTCLEDLFFGQIPASVLDSITERMPHLASIGAESVIDNYCFSTLPTVSTAKTVISMTNAVEAVTYKKMSAADAARLFQVSEKDLIHLTQTTNKLTDDEERAVILCCLRLSRMGFSVQKDTVMSKCQEMFARRYATTSAVPISDTYCLDLYVRNMPLFTPEIEITNSNPLRERFNIHYSALHRLYKSLWPQTTPTARNILVLDLKQFNLDKEPGFNTLRSVAVTVLSAMSACTSRSLPVMAVWPKRVVSTHLSLINVDSKRGMPTHFHVNQYLQVILSIVRERPLVIVCNGNASLLSERLISSSLSDWVYFYCVPPDIAKYVFPGFHGGLLYMLKDQLPNQGLNCGEVATRLMHLLKFKKQSIALSSSLAFTTTGVFPFNSRARIQYQTVNVNTTPHQSYSQQKFSNWAGRQLSHPPGEDWKFRTAEGSGDDKVRAESIINQEEERRGLTEKDKVQQKDKTENKVTNSDPTKPGLIVKTTKKATITRKQAHRHLTCAQVLAKKLLSQAKHRHESSHAVTLEIIMAPQSADTNVKRGTTRSSVRTGHKQRIQMCHRKPEVPFTEKAKELVGSRTETEVRTGQKQSIQTCHTKSRVPSTEQADELVGNSTAGEVAQTAVANHSRAVGDRISSHDERTQIAVTSNGWSSTRAQPDTSRKLDTKKQTSSYSGSSEASKTSPLIGSSSVEQVGRGKSGIRLLISNVRNNNRPSTVLVNHPHSKKYSNSEEESDSGDDMEMDDAIEDTLNKDVDDNIEDNRNPSSLKSDMVISSDRNNHKEDKNKRSKKRKRQSSEGGEEKVNFDKYGENSISENPVEENKKEDEKHQLRQKIPETSNAGAPDKKTSKVDMAGDASVSKLEDSPKAGDKASFDREEERKLKLLSHISLIDHDYIMKFDRSERNSSGDKSGDSSEPPESCEIPDDQEVEITASNVKTSKGISATGAIYGKGHKDVILAAASEDLTETVQCSVQYESIEESAKSDHDISGSSSSSNNNGYTSSSSSSDVEKSESSSPVKSHCNNTSNGTEENSSSSSLYSSASDNDNDDHQEDDGSAGGDNSDDNGQTSDVDEEEEDSDDDSKCQICMRSTPPHSKDTIIDWVDCDQNCGRWFHVICVSRSQSKGDTKSYICPSCRCQR